MRVIAKDGVKLKSEIKRQHRALTRSTFVRGRATKGWEKWMHKNYDGWIRFKEPCDGVLLVELRCKNEERLWQIFSAFMGYLSRNFLNKIVSVNTQFVK